MAKGSGSRNKSDSQTEEPVSQEVVRVDSRRRLLIPRQIGRNLTWMKSNGDSEILLVLDEPGRIRLLEWDVSSSKILEVERELASYSEKDQETLRKLRILKDKYRYAKIPADHRLLLTEEILLHLGLSSEPDPTLYVVRLGNEIELIAPDLRDRELLNFTQHFPLLP